MSHSHVIRASLVAMLVAAGCAEESTPGLSVEHPDAPEGLAFVFPEIGPEVLAHGEVVEVAPPSGPAGALGDDPLVPEEEPATEEPARIFGASTNVGFTSTYAYSAGRHSYTGNAGKVETEAIVTTLGGQTLGRQPAMREEYVPYLLDWNAVKTIWAEAYVFIDTDCGLRVDGQSNHSAWWQWFLGGPVPEWGQASLSTQAFPPEELPACSEVVESGLDTGGKDAGTDGSGGSATTCWYLVTWDPYTGEVLDSEFLYCDDVVGG